MELNAIFKLIIALSLGAAIGLEREIHQKKDNHKNRTGELIGVRTFALTTLLGSIVGLLSTNYMFFSLVITVILLLLITINYAISSIISLDTGITTEFAAVLSFIIGFLISVNLLPITVVLTIAIILIIILAYKDQVKNIVEEVHSREIKALISYAIIALVILPFLPNTTITLGDIPFLNNFIQTYQTDNISWRSLEIVNLFKTWLIVAIITGIDLVGYILEKMFGKNRSILISSMIGGFVSSTATTQSLAVQNKKYGNNNAYISGALGATLTSYFSLFLVIAPLNPWFALSILPILAILISMFGIMMFVFLPINKKADKIHVAHPQEREIFSLKPAIIFAILFIIIKIISSIAFMLFGSRGFLVAASIASFSGIDAIILNVADLSKNLISTNTAVYAFILVNAVNLIAKTLYISLQGTREFAFKFGISVLVIIILSCAGLFFI